MSKKNPGAAKRARKNHQKDLKRARQLALRRQAQQRRAREEHTHRHDPMAGWNPQVEGVQGFASWREMMYFVAARMVDRPSLPQKVWSLRRVHTLSTEELVRQLEALGISVNEAGFRQTFAQDWSISTAAERVWLPQLSPEAAVHDRDFVRLAACELHGRWLPDTPSHEALASAFLDSLKAHEAQEDERVVERGLSLWRLLRPHLSEHMHLTKDVDELLDLSESFSFWPPEFAISALRAVPQRPELAAPAAEILDEVLARFTEEYEDWRLSLQGHQARLLDAAGRGGEAEQLLRAGTARPT